MKTTLHCQQDFSLELPKILKLEDIRLSETFLQHFIEEYTRPRDGVYDPFAGFGRTLTGFMRSGTYDSYLAERPCQFKCVRHAITMNSMNNRCQMSVLVTFPLEQNNHKGATMFLASTDELDDTENF